MSIGYVYLNQQMLSGEAGADDYGCVAAISMGIFRGSTVRPATGTNFCYQLYLIPG